MNFPKNHDEAAAFIRRLYPEYATVPLIHAAHGQENFVILAPDCVFRLPRHEWAMKTRERESKLLNILTQHSPIDTPKLLDCNPEYGIMRISKMRGDHLTPEILTALDSSKQQHIINQIVDFLCFFHTTATQKIQRPLYKSDKTYSHAEIIKNIEKLKKLDLSAAQKSCIQDAEFYIREYKNHKDDRVLIHEDLVSGNMLYDHKTNAISNIDFGGCDINFRHLEFKKLNAYGAQICQKICIQYEEKIGTKINQHLVRCAYALNKIYNWKPEKHKISDFIVD